MIVPKAFDVGARYAWLRRNRDLLSEPQVSERPRLLVDVSTIIQHDAKTGIQRVVRAVWSELARRNGLDFVAVPVFATKIAGYSYAPDDFLDRKPGEDAVPVTAGANDKFLGLDLAAHVLPKYRRQLQAWRANGATVHMLVYDLLPLIRPDWFSDRTVRNFRKWFDLVVTEADQAICISRQVATDVRRQLNATNSGRHPALGRLRLGGDIAASMPSTGVSAEVRRLIERVGTRPFVLTVGTIEPRKGYDVALAAFEELWRADRVDTPDLVIVGKAGWKTDGLQQTIRAHPQRDKRLHWLTDVSDEGLCSLYDSCNGVFLPSRGEGCGLPLLEAASHRRPVLARELPVFQEELLPGVEFFADDRPATLAERLMDLTNGRRAPGPAPRLPTWSACVRDLLSQLGMPISEQIEDALLPSRHFAAAGH